jgi:hypothetical protein
MIAAEQVELLKKAAREGKKGCDARLILDSLGIAWRDEPAPVVAPEPPPAPAPVVVVEAVPAPSIQPTPAMRRAPIRWTIPAWCARLCRARVNLGASVLVWLAVVVWLLARAA